MLTLSVTTLLVHLIVLVFKDIQGMASIAMVIVNQPMAFWILFLLMYEHPSNLFKFKYIIWIEWFYLNYFNTEYSEPLEPC